MNLVNLQILVKTGYSGKYFVDPVECGDSGESGGPGDYGKTDDSGKTGKSD